MKARPWPYARVLAHRGGGALAPENTLAAIRTGYAHGFRAVEFDAMLPSDETPVLMHDPTLARTARVEGKVTDWSAARLKQLDVGSWHSAQFAGEPVPTLADALAFCRGHGIWPNVEIKPAPGRDGPTGAAVARETARAYADVLVPGSDPFAPLIRACRCCHRFRPRLCRQRARLYPNCRGDGWSIGCRGPGTWKSRRWAACRCTRTSSTCHRNWRAR
jgi:glycerophosphoryl diester phosphodiesterase